MQLKITTIPLSLILSPITMMVVIMSLGLLNLLIPKRWYEDLMGEHNYMILNLPLALFIMLCVFTFVSGSWLMQILLERVVHPVTLNTRTRRHDLYSSRILLFLVTVLNLVLIGYLQSKLGLGSILQGVGGSTESVRRQIAELTTGANLSWVPIFTSAVLLWGIWAMPLKTKRHDWVWWLIPATLLLVNVLLTLTRTTLIELILPLLAITVRRRFIFAQISVRWLARVVVKVLFFGLLVLGALTFARGQNGMGEPILRSLVGYGPASFNRFAAVYEGVLHYPNEGSTYYAAQGLYDMPILGPTFSDIGRRHGLSLPTSNFQNWRQQFISVQQASLRIDYIWATAPGQILADIGRAWTAFWFFVFGLISGALYTLYLKGRSLGLVLYPFIFSAILQSWSIPRVVQSTALFFILAAVLVILLRRVPIIVRRRSISAHPSMLFSSDRDEAPRF